MLVNNNKVKTKLHLATGLLCALILSITGFGWFETTHASGLPPTPVPTDESAENFIEQVWRDAHASRPAGFGRVESMPPALAGVEDAFGYTLDDEAAFDWIDTAAFTQTQQIFPDPDNPDEGVDDVVADPVPIGFSFPFYENTYTEVYISPNGLLSFGEGTADNDNKMIPSDMNPNNFVAAFWDDLAVGGDFNSGVVNYLNGVNGNGQYLVVEWYLVSRFGNNVDWVIFEAILYASGDICVQFQDMNGVLDEATVGIEDEDGVNGLLYIHNSPGIEDVTNICFYRPPASVRVKNVPAYQSALMEAGTQQYLVQVENIGNVSTDVFDFDFRLDVTSAQATQHVLANDQSEPEAPAAAQWNVTLLDENGFTPIVDTDSDGKSDTGDLGIGDTMSITVQIDAPETVVSGDYATLVLTTTSSLDTDKFFTVTIQAVAPAPFAQVFVDSASGINFDRILPASHTENNVVGLFTGSVIALAQTHRNNYVFAWEVNAGTYSDVTYTILSPFGKRVAPLSKVAENEFAAIFTLDTNPRVAAAADGRIGLVWARTLVDIENSQTNSNIYLSLLKADGTVFLAPTNITNNDAWVSEGVTDIPIYSSPAIVATTDNHFVIMWHDTRTQSEGQETDVEYAIYNTSGSVLAPPDTFRDGSAGDNEERFTNPSLIELTGNRVLVAYVVSVTDIGNNTTTTLRYQVIDSDGNNILGETAITGTNGVGVDGVQLNDNRTILAWTNPNTLSIEFALLSDNGSSLIVDYPTLNSLPNPDGREGDFVSVTKTENELAVLTWMDADANERLYYAMVSPTGEIITPPIIYRTGAAAQPFVQGSTVGQGNAPVFFRGFVYVPVIMR